MDVGIGVIVFFWNGHENFRCSYSHYAYTGPQSPNSAGAKQASKDLKRDRERKREQMTYDMGGM